MKTLNIGENKDTKCSIVAVFDDSGATFQDLLEELLKFRLTTETLVS